MSRLTRSLTALALALLCATGAWAQSQATTGVIEGTVKDETGAVLPGATVTVRNTDTGFEKVLQSDASGRFYAPLLPLGPYRVTVALEGFATLVREGFDLAVGQTVTLPLDMKVATAEEQITVTAGASITTRRHTAIDTPAADSSGPVMSTNAVGIMSST